MDGEEVAEEKVFIEKVVMRASETWSFLSNKYTYRALSARLALLE